MNCKQKRQRGLSFVSLALHPSRPDAEVREEPTHPVRPLLDTGRVLVVGFGHVTLSSHSWTKFFVMNPNPTTNRTIRVCIRGAIPYDRETTVTEVANSSSMLPKRRKSCANSRYRAFWSISDSISVLTLSNRPIAPSIQSSSDTSEAANRSCFLTSRGNSVTVYIPTLRNADENIPCAPTNAMTTGSKEISERESGPPVVNAAATNPRIKTAVRAVRIALSSIDSNVAICRSYTRRALASASSSASRPSVILVEVLPSLVSYPVKGISRLIKPFDVTVVKQLSTYSADIVRCVASVFRDVVCRKPQIMLRHYPEYCFLYIPHFRELALSGVPMMAINSSGTWWESSVNGYLPDWRFRKNAITPIPVILSGWVTRWDVDDANWVSDSTPESEWVRARTRTQCARRSAMKQPNERASVYAEAQDNDSESCTPTAYPTKGGRPAGRCA